MTEGSDATPRNHRRRPTVSRRPTHGRVSEDEEKEKEDTGEIKLLKDDIDGKAAQQQGIKSDLSGLLRFN